MKITKETNGVFKVEIKNKGIVTIDFTNKNKKSAPAVFVEFFRQLAIAQGMDMNGQNFLETINEVDIFDIATVIAGRAQGFNYAFMFNEAERLWNTSYTENIVRGQKLLGISEEDYDYVQLLECKIDPKWLKKYIDGKKINKIMQKQPLLTKDEPILQENFYAGYVN